MARPIKKAKHIFIVYLIYNTVNGKYYVGWTSRRFNERWYDHCSDTRRGSTLYLHRAIALYGKDAFEHQILAIVSTEKEVKSLESLWIISLRSYDPEVGYNTTFGGEGEIPTEETRRKRGISSKLSWERKSENEKAILINELKSNLHNWLQNRTEEERQTASKINSEVQLALWASLSEEEFEAIRKQRSEQFAKNWASKSEEERKEIGEHISNALKGKKRDKPAWNKGKTNIELYGEEKAAEISSNLSKMNSIRRDSGETKRKKSEVRKKMIQEDPEIVANIARVTKARWADPEFRKVWAARMEIRRNARNEEA
jgi:group I intron endonuclease